MSMGTPSVLDLPTDDASKARFTHLAAAFQEVFKVQPEFYVRAPGRVNLIGEHIDYCGYAVLPMAIEQSILMAVAEEPRPRLTLANVDPTYAHHETSIDDIYIDKSKLQWYNYLLSGFLGFREHCKGTCKGMRVMVDGNIPPSAGLSSSSALVCAAVLAASHVNQCKLSKLEMASLSAKCERYVGTEGGGMDQAICFLGEPGTAKLIEFNPLKAHDVHLPNGAVFVIGNSLSDINKAATSQYNTRVVECRLATKVLAKLLGQNWQELSLLGSLQAIMDLSAEAMAAKVRELLHPEPYSRQEVCELLGLADNELAEKYLSQNTLQLQEFELYKRALHVYTESQRVLSFKRVCDEGSANALQLLGDFMNKSHASCRDQYECSHPDLDELVNVALKNGAIGSRLTGAGWGGCTVSLVHETQVDEFLSKVEKDFYQKIEERRKRLSTSLFRSAPACGAVIYQAAK